MRMTKMRPEDLPEETLLIQLAEEASELSQACCKLVRAMHGDTPVSVADARKNLLEEMADTMLCIKVKTTRMEDAEINGTMLLKYTRWRDRINEHV